MKRTILSFSFLLLALVSWSACSNKSASKESQKAYTPDKIQGKALVMTESMSDSAMNAGGQSVYLVEGLRRYRLFFNTATDVANGKEYAAEGVYAQKAIDDMGDPDQGKNGYPLPDRCEHVVHMAWSGLALDVAAGDAEVLCEKVKRYPARAIFLVTHIEPVAAKSGEEPKKDEGEDVTEISVPADKERAAMIEGPKVQTAPLWDPAGGTVSCKVLIGQDGKISELQTGNQLCESVTWSQVRFQPPVQRGHPVKVKTEVEVRFDPRK